MSRKKQALFQPEVVAKRLSVAISRDFSGLDRTVFGHNSKACDVFATRQRTDFLKKFVWSPNNDKTLRTRAFKKFLETCEHMKSVNHRLESDLPWDKTLQSSDLSEIDRILLRMRSFIHLVLGDLDQENWFEQCRVSNGATVGTKYTDTSVEAKFRYPLTHSGNVNYLWDLYESYDPRFCEGVRSLNKYSNSPKFKKIPAARGTSVPKDSTIDRFIAKNGTLNGFFQQGLMTLMTIALKPFCDMSVAQDKHGKLSWLASITQNYGTIDFSSASDCVSEVLLRFLLPPRWFSALNLVRHSFVSLDGANVPLPMFSTMGDANTFPLETLLFTSVLHVITTEYTSNYTALPDMDRKPNYSVFGDDCIVPTDKCQQFINCCTYFGFIVNEKKSYFDKETRFRESCGQDYYSGYSVRPFYLRAPTGDNREDLQAWINIVFNRLIKKYILYFGSLTYCYDKALWNLLSKLCSEYGLAISIVPDDFPDDSGFKFNGDFRMFRNFSKNQKTPIYVIDDCYNFSYLKYTYPIRYRRNNTIRFAQSIKSVVLKRETVPFVSIKRKGRYSLSAKGRGILLPEIKLLEA